MIKNILNSIIKKFSFRVTFQFLFDYLKCKVKNYKYEKFVITARVFNTHCTDLRYYFSY